jgi:hypothetical protein
MEPVELTGANLKRKYRSPKPRGRFRADYGGNSGKPRHKHTTHANIHGARRKELARKTRS